jgi:hypothetical protein
VALTKAHLVNLSASPAVHIEVQFNPTECSITRNVHYAEIAVPGLQMPLQQFVHGEAQTLSIELLLDGTGAGPTVKARLEQLRQLVTIAPALQAPPICQFVWGKDLAAPAGISFKGVVTALTERFVLFDQDGNALRARVTLSLKSYASAAEQAQQIDPKPDQPETVTVREGERLDLMANDKLGASENWRTIARHNNVARPGFLSPGRQLELPPR